MPTELDPRVLDFIEAAPAGPQPTLAQPICQPCTSEQIDEAAFAKWCQRFGHEVGPNRKLWEWAYICEAIEQHAEQVGRPLRLLGFGVGQEPIVGWFAAQGHDIVATDLPSDDENSDFWTEDGQHAASIDQLDRFDLCPKDELRRRVSFRPVDMRVLPPDLRGFDAVWSSCAFEHLGTLDAGLEFVWGSLGTLRPGGVAVHTTEFNVSSSTDTIAEGPVVLYRVSDLEEFRSRASGAGFASDATYHLGDHPQRGIVDHPPYSVPHLKILNGGHVTTSYGLILHNRNSWIATTMRTGRRQVARVARGLARRIRSRRDR